MTILDPSKPITRLVCAPHLTDALQAQAIAGQLEQIDPTVNWVILGVSSVTEIPTPQPPDDQDNTVLSFEGQGSLRRVDPTTERTT